jgi:phenylalanyl-tRNA synthetase beta chain
MKTAESEGVHVLGSHFAKVVRARVKSAEAIPGSKNRKAIIDAGPLGERVVVCGAPNCRQGLLTAYVPSGTTLEGREIRKAVVSGIESDGMLASGAELGINRNHDGILEFHEGKPGEPLAVEPDSIIEIDNKSLTHRPDLWGHHGMAREVAAIFGKTLLDPAKLDRLPEGVAPIQVSISEFDLCPRYSALVFENVTVQESPLWLQQRLESVGLNAINNIVDVTNYVMAELAQPMHAFDADKLQGGTIYVRTAQPGEQCKALNGETYELNSSNLVIADAGGPIAIAGVIGGNDSAIGAGTTRIVLESANFQASSIRKTSSALKLRTDASMRFEKAQDPHNTVRGLARAIDLLRQVSPGIRLAGGVVDQSRTLVEPPPIELPLDWLDRKLGRAIDDREVRRILESLSFGVLETSPRVFSVTVPSWRATKDISIKDDLVEEVGRMIGYASITPQAPALPARVPLPNVERAFHHRLRSVATQQGYHEVYNYSFLSEDTAARFGFAPEQHVRVLNPIAADQGLMRLSLIPGIWKNINENSKYAGQFRLFEIGKEIHPKDGDLPEEIYHLAAAIYAKEATDEHLFELKRLAESLAPGVRVIPAQARPYEHPARSADLLLDGTPVGRLFEFHPHFVETGRAGVLDMNLAQLAPLANPERRYQAIQRFPSSAFDLSVIADVRQLVGTLQDELVKAAGEGLDHIEFVRQYSGPPLPEGKKSVSYRLTVSAPDRTLSSEDVTAIRTRIITGLRERGYDLRV